MIDKDKIKTRQEISDSKYFIEALRKGISQEFIFEKFIPLSEYEKLQEEIKESQKTNTHILDYVKDLKQHHKDVIENIKKEIDKEVKYKRHNKIGLRSTSRFFINGYVKGIKKAKEIIDKETTK